MSRFLSLMMDLGLAVGGLTIANIAVTEASPFLFGVGAALGAIGVMECADQIKEARR